jgi:hypothetical protein
MDNIKCRVRFHDVGFTTPAVCLHIAGNPSIGSTQQINNIT